MIDFSDVLVVIPARKGSKGIPGKNSKILGHKPLIQHSIDFAKQFFNPNQICVTTDDDKVIEIAERFEVPIKFKRPDELSGDKAGMREVLLHAIENFPENKNQCKRLLLLQPTSPFRKNEHLEGLFKLWNNDLDMVVSTTESKASPYFTLYEENKNGLIEISKKSVYKTRQETPKVYAFNGSMYLMTFDAIINSPISEFKNIKSYNMPSIYAIDLDVELDWVLAEHILNHKLI